MDKGVDKNIQSTFDRFTEEKVYWIILDKEKIMVTKALYDKVEPAMKIRMNRTKNGMAIE